MAHNHGHTDGRTHERTDIRTDEHGDSMTESAQWGRSSENQPQGVCGKNIHWRRHQIYGNYFLQWDWSKIFVTLAILYFFLVHIKSFDGHKHARKKYNVVKITNILDYSNFKNINPI